MKIILISFVIIVFNLYFAEKNSFSNNVEKQVLSIDYQVSQINRLTLKKYFMKKETDYDFVSTALYIDKKNRMRKIVLKSGSEERNWINYLYYSTKGKLILEIYNYIDMGGADGRGRRYFANQKAIKTIGSGASYDPPDFKLKNKMTSIVYSYKRSNEFKLQGYYTFRVPKKGDSIEIIYNNVILRSKPTTKSRKLTKLFTIHDKGKVLALGKKETIKPFGTFRWYKIHYYGYYPMLEGKDVKAVTGWVFGAFINPIEIKVL